MELVKNKDGQQFLRVQSVADIDRILGRYSEGGNDGEFFVLLNFGCRSSKDICRTDSGKYRIFNGIDGSSRTVTAKQLTPEKSIIGEAMVKGAFFHALECRDCEMYALCHNDERHECGGCPSLKVSRELIDAFDTKGKARKPCQTRSS